MDCFGISESELDSLGAKYTAWEIWNQPVVWKLTMDKIEKEQDSISDFLKIVFHRSQKIILTGAGTSAFIGYSLEGTFQRNTGIITVSVPSTHLVTHPEDYLQLSVPTLVISFARSGNSPESSAVLELTDKLCEECYHLIISCDKNGALAKHPTRGKKYTFLLPPDSNDQGLAMTGSYSSMLLTGLFFSRLGNMENLRNHTGTVINYASSLLKNFSGTLMSICQNDFDRVVFLGSGPQYGTAIESHLKMQELTDGQIICQADSFLGFRHGPKAVVNKRTIVVYLFSNDDYVFQYEKDLVMSMGVGKGALYQIGISERPIDDLKLNQSIVHSDQAPKLEEEFLTLCNILPAQIMGLFKSIHLGLRPDAPSVSGAISRIVEGVTIYDFKHIRNITMDI